jgi:NADH-quinone oxidoreductase subunit A
VLLGYLPILIWVVLSAGLVLAVLYLSHVLGRKRPTAQKLSPYECGVTPVGDARGRFPTKFYIIAVVFLVFDIEAAFLYPWAVIYKRLAFVGLIEMGLFIAILLVGYLYLWKKRVFDWEE